MLNYDKYSLQADREVVDPVSGNWFPRSLTDVHAHQIEQKQSEQDSAIASMLSSILK